MNTSLKLVIFFLGAPPLQTLPSCPVGQDVELPLEQQTWYHGVIPRLEVQQLLGKDGDFLVRKSQEKPGYVLSVQWGGACKHFLIQNKDVSWLTSPQRVSLRSNQSSPDCF